MVRARVLFQFTCSDIDVDLLPTLTNMYIIHRLSQNSCVEFKIYSTCITDYYWSEIQ